MTAYFTCGTQNNHDLDNQVDDYLNRGSSWNTLTQTEKENLAGLCIESEIGDCDLGLFISESDDLELLVTSLARHLKRQQTDVSIKELLTKMALKYYAKHLERLFEEREGELDYDRKIDAGLRPWIDPQNGELEWYNPR